ATSRVASKGLRSSSRPSYTALGSSHSWCRGRRAGVGNGGSTEMLTRQTTKGILLLWAGSLVACSGSPTSALSGPAPTQRVSDSGVGFSYAGSDAGADTQAASPGAPLVGRGDNFSPDGGSDREAAA